MTLNRFWLLFFSTLFLGMLTGIANAIFGWFGHFSLYFGMELGGFVSATALMGFWAYLMLNYTANTMLDKRLWGWIQVLIVGFAVFDLIYFRHLRFGGDQADWRPYIAYAVYPLAWSALVAAAKVFLTDKRAYLPTLFFMYVFTVLEWYVALRWNFSGVTETVGLILLVCNAWLVLILGKILVKKEKRGAR